MQATIPTAPKQSKPRPKPARSVRILEQPCVDSDFWGAIEISMTTGVRSPRTEKTVYLVRFIPSDFGNGAVGFEVEKLDADLAAVETYHVHLSDNPAEVSCDCKGHEAHGHCKHREGIEALRRAGKLVPPQRSASSAAKNDPDAYAAHMASLGDFGPVYGLTEGEYPSDEPPSIPFHADFDPAEEGIEPPDTAA